MGINIYPREREREGGGGIALDPEDSAGEGDFGRDLREHEGR